MKQRAPALDLKTALMPSNANTSGDLSADQHAKKALKARLTIYH